MSVIGIVCEYNPFHKGHAWQIRQSRRAVPDSPVICVMSGDFVQRGEAAIYTKFARAEAACRCGADLVVELPLPWSLCSAEGFARGAVGLLGRLGVSHLCFGSETGDLEPLERIAQTLLSPGLQNQVREALGKDPTLSYAAAREQAVSTRLGEESELLRQPNNILAVEYIKAIYDLHLDMSPVAILRRGSGHDQSGHGAFLAAAQIRSLLHSGADVGGAIPAPALEVFRSERELGRELSDRNSLELALLSRLRMLDDRAFLDLPDAEDGLGRRLCRAVREETDYDGILAATKTKRYAMSRIRRLSMCACLGVKTGMSQGLPPYARILAFNDRGRELIRQASSRCLIPLISKPAAVKDLGRDSQELFALGAKAHDLYVLGFRARSQQRPGQDWRTGPAVVTAPLQAEEAVIQYPTGKKRERGSADVREVEKHPKPI